MLTKIAYVNPCCHTIVIFRAQVYKGEFVDWADQTLGVVELSNWQIQRFLYTSTRCW